jgi:AcrR family transcriptional regulator
VSISKANSYHHGDLKSALIEAGVTMLAQEGIEGLNLRKIARQVGVSHNAPYMHFADKQALIASIAQQGFLLLSRAIEEALQSRTEAALEERLMAIGHAYVNFALAHPSHLMVMFGDFPQDDYPELMEASHGTFTQLVELMADSTQHLLPQPPAQLALLFWVNLHGLSVLLISNKIPDYAFDGLSQEALTTLNIKIFCKGILALPEKGSG